MIGIYTFAKQQLNFRRGIVLALPLLAAAMGILIAQDRINPGLILAATVLPLGIITVYRFSRFEYGIVAILLAAGLLNFFTLPAGGSRIVVSLMITMGLVGRWVVQTVLINKHFQLKASPVNLPLLLFVAINFISYGWGNTFRDPMIRVWDSFPFMQLAALTTNVFLPLLLMLVFYKLDDLKWLKWLTWILIAMGALYLVLYRVYPSILAFILNRGSGGLFALWVGALTYSMALFNEKLPLWKRGLLIVLVMVLFHRYFVEGRLWLSGWFPLLAACSVITFMRSKKFFILVVLVVSLYVGMNFDEYYQSIVVSNEDEGGLERLDLWRMNLEHVANHPFFGMGPAGYAVYNMAYHPQDARSTHNNYFDILAQTGVIGFGVFLWLFITLGRMGYQNCRMLAGQRNFEEAFANATLAGCLSALAAMMLGDWVLPFAYNGTIAAFDHAAYTWIFLGGLTLLYYQLKTNPAATLETQAG